jgi:Flp pilus assembly protein TadG
MTTSSFVQRLRTDESGGAVTWWLIGMASVAILMFALVADGSRVMAELNETSDVAQVAARAGARFVDPSTGTLDATRAEEAALTEVTAAGMTGSVTVNGSEITVSVSSSIDLPLLAIVGVSEHTVTSTRASRTVSGP